jgi:hypothetical protein
MSRQQSIQTSYDKPRLLIGVVVGLTALITILIPVILSMRTVTPEKKAADYLPPDKITPTDIPNLNLETPTPFPTLTEEEFQELNDQIKQMEGPDITVPPEALEELDRMRGNQE